MGGHFYDTIELNAPIEDNTSNNLKMISNIKLMKLRKETHWNSVAHSLLKRKRKPCADRGKEEGQAAF